jgi:hypothetical protein
MSDEDGARQILQPSLNGSVFEALILMCMYGCLLVISSKHNVDSEANVWMCDETYSEDLRKLKNAVVTAAHNMSLS